MKSYKIVIEIPWDLSSNRMFTSNPLGQIKIQSDSLVLRDFNNNPLGFREIP